MIGYFKERSSLQVPALIFLGFLLKVGYVSHHATDSSPLPEVGGLLPGWLQSNVLPVVRPGFANGIALLLLFGSAIYANVVASNGRMFNQRHLLVALSVLLFTSILPPTNTPSAALIILPLFIAIFEQITKLYATNKARPAIVNAGILTGLCYLLYHPFVFLVPAVFFGLGAMRPFKLAEWLLLLLGIFTPLYFALAIDFLSNNWHPARHLPHFVIGPVSRRLGLYWWTTIGTIIIWLFSSISGWQNQSRRMLIQARKNWYILQIAAVCCIPGIFIPAGNAPEMLTLLAFPAGVMLANAFTNEEKGVGQLLFFWFIIIVIAFVSWGWKNGGM